MMTRKILACGAVMAAVLAVRPAEARADHRHGSSFFEFFFGLGSEDGYVRAGGWGGRPAYTPSPVPLPAPCPAPRPRIWVPEHYETRTVAREVAGYWREERVPALYETRYDECGYAYTVLVRPASCRHVWIPARQVCEQVQVLVPGHWREA